MTEKKTPEESTYNAKKVVELEREVFRLEQIISHLQSRIANIAASYETEIAYLRGDLAVEQKYGAEETE